ncbi:MAG TPA: hypothetical protein VEI94_05805 [Candidatus Bathyarchaeia archaeon]|jgi:hypothetical protein|nr:hypothetical protein [Candidatus Bathyarchaeia archaeon]
MEVDETVQQAQAIFRFADEVNRRLAEHGISGIEDLLSLYAQFKRALGTLGQSELEWAASEADRLMNRLKQICSELEHLRTLKAEFEVRH